ncbi:hypothetical protein F8B43_0577 [Methylorubrum populi]|uniref:Uncharacterized protein n=1 Tax=Methylorubrum populi TaxID=223967 RepID=A0A833J8X6_9HYPH|nr:hypothetical protein F8B43_0577 [Methylorubrum populi]
MDRRPARRNRKGQSFVGWPSVAVRLGRTGQVFIAHEEMPP